MLRVTVKVNKKKMCLKKILTKGWVKGNNDLASCKKLAVNDFSKYINQLNVPLDKQKILGPHFYSIFSKAHFVKWIIEY